MRRSHSLLSRVFARFSDQKAVILRLLQDNHSFRILCRDYQECGEALAYWTDAASQEAPVRTQEYRELLDELEKEIEDYLQNDTP